MMEVGNVLKEARIAKGLSLEEIQEQTKIQKRYLLAVEEDNLHLLPGKFYARAFIREYALAVDLNPDDLLGEAEIEVPKEITKNNVTYSRMWSRKVNSQTKNTSSFSFVPLFIVVLLIIGIIFVAITLYQKAMNDDADPIDPDNSNGFIRDNTSDDTIDSDDVVADTEEPEEELEEEPEETNPEFELIDQQTGRNTTSTYELKNAGDQITLELSSTGETWLDVQDSDGTSIYTGTLTESESPLEFDISDEEKVYIRTGYAEALGITVNDTPLDIETPPSVQIFWIHLQEGVE